MKKILILFLTCFYFLTLNAQNHELSLSYSPLSLYKFEKLVEGTDDSQHNYKVLGAFNIDYYRYMNDWLKLGVSVMYDQASIEGNYSPYYTPYYYTSSPLTQTAYKSTKHAFVVAPQIDFEYLRHTKFRLSSGLSIGYGNEKMDYNGPINTNVDTDGLTFHINLLSFRWGKKQGLCGSIGAGYKGFCNLGYFVRF
ncbi:MAG: hypothetical protein N4A74_13635 [Carboxylicivirga sp.]|jgi:outer membrane receptor protein involved in Fe transport|nr:hypothetical protein [Carboxylicivirga sp.]